MCDRSSDAPTMCDGMTQSTPICSSSRLARLDRRGYFKARLTATQMEVDLRFVTSVESPTGTGYLERRWVVEDGQPGAQDA